jgi:ribosomal-protein-alanine N-acetyltransferase
MLVTMIEAAIALKAIEVTLEVRESNHGAQQLYAKYGFEPSGLRRAYYTDNREDALIMTVGGIQTPAYVRKLAELKSRLYERLTVPASS